MRYPIIFIVAAAVLLSTGAASAQTLEIDDDGYRWTEGRSAPGFVVDIDDDGWSRATRSGNVPAATIPTWTSCSQLERTMGVEAATCGTLPASALHRMKTGRDN